MNAADERHEHEHQLIAERVADAEAPGLTRTRQRDANKRAVWTFRSHLRAEHGLRPEVSTSIADLTALHDQAHAATNPKEIPMTAKTADRPTLPRLRSLFADSAAIADRIGVPLDAWPQNCHGVSLAIVKSGIIPEAFPGSTCRVARGWTLGVGGQHSWVVIGDDCYDEAAIVVDPTLFSYDDDVTGTVVARARTRPWEPHGAGSIWTYGCPPPAEGEVIDLTPEGGWSREAAAFMAAIGHDLDLHGWTILANAPVGGWPAGEIIEAMAADERTAPRVPIDRLGMLTDRNPGGLYLPGPELS